MNVLDSIAVDHVGVDPRTIVLCSGDIGSIPADIDLQYLAIACTPGEYAPEDNPVVAELDALGIQVAAVQKNFLQHDFRPCMPCWSSRRFTLASAHFRHLLVWEPQWLERSGNSTRLSDVHYAFQALNRLHGYAGGGTAMFLLWPGINEDTAQDMLRMQFFSAVALAGRSAWSTLYLMVPPETASMAAAWFAVLAEQYRDPIAAFLEDRANLPGKDSLLLGQGKKAADNDGQLTERQFQAIYAYTNYSYAGLRRALRRDDPRHPDFVKAQALMEATSTALSRLTNYAGDRLIRAFDLPEYPNGYYRDGYETRELAYCSTSLIQLPYGDWYLHLFTTLGKDIARYSMYPTEYEVLHDFAMTCVATHIEAHDDASSEGHVLAHERMPAHVGLRDTHL